MPASRERLDRAAGSGAHLSELARETRVGPGGATRAPPLVADLFRRESGRLIALLASRYGAARLDDVEDSVQDALLGAMRAWPLHGVPARPSAWLYSAARNALVDRLRRTRFEAPSVDGALPEPAGVDTDLSPSEEFDDDTLRLVIFCCHPALSPSLQLALTLRLACGLGVEEIASALFTQPSAIAQRLVRAKRELRERGIELELPSPEAIARERLPGVLHALYLLFDAGYLSAAHAEWLRPTLCADALRLARALAGHPSTARPETHALAALLAFCAARLPARSDAAGRPVPLARQDRGLWDRELTAAGFRHLDRSIGGDTLTRYHIEAAIAATHAQARSIEETDWRAILRYYDQLCAVHPSPAASLNRLIALRYAAGPRAALDAGRADPALEALEGTLGWHATLGALHEALGESRQAADAFDAAAQASESETLRELFRDRAREARSRAARFG